MAGSLTIGTLSDGTNSTSSTNCIQGSAKAWTTFNGISGSLSTRKAYNVGSYTQFGGDGLIQINFSTALADVNYSVLGNQTYVATTGGSASRILNVYSAATNTTTYCQLRGNAVTAGNNQSDWMCVAIFD